MKFKHILSIILVFTLFLSMCSVALANETADIPEGYTPIYTAEELYNIRNNLEGKYVLMNDIDLSVYENWEPIGTYDIPFIGDLDGNGKSILNLTIKNFPETEEDFFGGLFAKIHKGCVKDITFVNVDINLHDTDTYAGEIHIGALAGSASNAYVYNCIATGKISVDGFTIADVGGLFGIEYMTIPTGCINYSDLSVSSDKFSETSVGGIAGISTAIRECGNYGNISLSSNNSDNDLHSSYVGGICGNSHQFGNLIENCYNRGSVSVDFTTPSTYIGGLMGEAWIISNSYNTGDIIYPEDFDGCYGAVVGNICSSLLAMVTPGLKTENIYYLDQDIIPAFEDNYIPDDLTQDPFDQIHLLTEEEFKKQESFIGFDFENIWEMEENGYPVFKNQHKIVAEKHNVSLEAGKNCSIGITDFNWETSDPFVALLTEDGVIMAHDPGEAILTVEHPYGYIIEYHVTVTDPYFIDTPDPEEPAPVNNVESAEIVSVPLKNRIVFGYGSPNSPEGIVLKLKFKDGTEKTETIIRTDSGCYAGEEYIFGGVHLEVVDFGKHTETLYINDETVSVEYDYFVIPPLRSVIYKLFDTFFGFLFPIRMF